MSTLIPILIILIILALILGAILAVLFMFRKREKPELHLYCSACETWNYHTLCGPQLDEKNQLVFLLYTCNSCKTTRALK
jgi:flagellar basal body-associated protein FliL